jgi:hypothetical protein
MSQAIMPTTISHMSQAWLLGVRCNPSHSHGSS